MARTFEYAVLTAIPDPRRGERANVGLIVFKPDRVDVRLQSGLFKLRALTGQAMESRLEAAQTLYAKLFSAENKPIEMLRRFQSVEPLLVPSDLGWFAAETDSQYEERVGEIMASLIAVPRREKGDPKSRVKTEIGRAFEKANVLAGPDETLRDHKVVRDYVVDEDKGLVADFALKNGKLHVASTLDLRNATIEKKDAALKALTLDSAKKRTRGTIRIGIYAIHRDMRDHYHQQLAIFEGSTDRLFNWGDRESKKALSHHFQDAMGLPKGGLF